jgi:hypothetical protein
MFQGHGRVLKGRVEIRQGKMSGVARLCEEAEIGKTKLPDQVGLLLKRTRIALAFVCGVGEQASQDQGLNEEVKEEEARFSHRRQSSPFMTSLSIS